MSSRQQTLSAIALLTLALLTACGRNSDAPRAAATITVDGARRAVLIGDVLTYVRPSTRPSAPLGIYTNIYMSGGGFLQASTAAQAAIAQVKFHQKPTEEQVDATYSLLQEFASVLQVDIADLLNRSDDRKTTLDEYSAGLKNITERSRARTKELEQFIGQLREEQTQKRRVVSTLDRSARDATRTEDFVTAGEKQQELSNAQGDLAKTEADLKQQQGILRSFNDLLKVADKRLTAIEQNREILIAGLKVINVPGAEGLGVVEGSRSSRRGGGGLGPLLGL